jgi:hypothetical protein
MQTHTHAKQKKSEIQHAQSNERERLMVQKNCTVFCANRTYKKKERKKNKERIIAIH